MRKVPVKIIGKNVCKDHLIGKCNDNDCILDHVPQEELEPAFLANFVKYIQLGITTMVDRLNKSNENKRNKKRRISD